MRPSNLKYCQICLNRANPTPPTQPIRRYATDQPPIKPQATFQSTYALLATAVIGGAGGAYYFFGRDTAVAKKAESKIAAAATGPAKKALTGGDQGFVSQFALEVSKHRCYERELSGLTDKVAY